MRSCLIRLIAKIIYNFLLYVIRVKNWISVLDYVKEANVASIWNRVSSRLVLSYYSVLMIVSKRNRRLFKKKINIDNKWKLKK